MAAVRLNLGRRLVIFCSKEELMKFHNIGFQCLRNDAVTVLSDVCLSSGHRESLCISYMEFAQISGKRDQICHLYICSQLRHYRLDYVVDCRPICCLCFVKSCLKDNSLPLCTGIVCIAVADSSVSHSLNAVHMDETGLFDLVGTDSCFINCFCDVRIDPGALVLA